MTRHGVDGPGGHRAERHMPDAEGQRLRNPAHRRSLEESDPQRQSRRWGSSGRRKVLERVVVTAAQQWALARGP